MPPHRLEPRVPLGHDAALLGDLALEQVRLGTLRSERRIASLHQRGQRAELRRARPAPGWRRAASGPRRPGIRRTRRAASRPGPPGSTVSRKRGTVSIGSAAKGMARRLRRPSPSKAVIGAAPPRGPGPPRRARAAVRAGCTARAPAPAPAGRADPRPAGGSRVPAGPRPLGRAVDHLQHHRGHADEDDREEQRATTSAIHGCPWAIAAFRMVNSLRKSPNGGDPVTANSPSSSSTAGHRRRGGGFRARSRRMRDPVSSTTLPTARNIEPLDQRVVDEVKHRAVAADAAQPEAEHQQAHVLHARVGQQALQVRLADHEGRRDDQRHHAERKRAAAARTPPGRRPS